MLFACRSRRSSVWPIKPQKDAWMWRTSWWSCWSRCVSPPCRSCGTPSWWTAHSCTSSSAPNCPAWLTPSWWSTRASTITSPSRGSHCCPHIRCMQSSPDAWRRWPTWWICSWPWRSTSCAKDCPRLSNFSIRARSFLSGHQLVNFWSIKNCARVRAAWRCKGTKVGKDRSGDDQIDGTTSEFPLLLFWVGFWRVYLLYCCMSIDSFEEPPKAFQKLL